MATRLFFDVQQVYKPRISRKFDVEPYTESEFQARYRFSPNSLHILADLLHEQLIRPAKWSHEIPIEMLLKIALRIYATGSFFYT